MTKNLRRGLIVLSTIPVGIFIFVTVGLLIVHRANNVSFAYEHNGTDLTFASSDGIWRGEEDMLRGRDFGEVLIDFEAYRLRANRSDVKLLRTKPWKKPWQWAWWFDRRASPKWKVPYVPAEQLPPAGGEIVSSQNTIPDEQVRPQRAVGG